MKTKFSLATFVALFLAGGGVLHAEMSEASENSDDTIATYELPASVITASGFKQNTTLAPASISVANPKEIGTRPVRDLAEAIANLPGVSIDSGVAKPNGYSLSIRGSTDIVVLIDGRRVNAGGDEVFPNGYNSTNSFMPPLSAIERIEVIRGPASTLYGSDAMGGVVNIITKKNFDIWGASFKYDYTLQEEKRFPNNQSFSFYTAGPLNEAKNWGLTLRGKVWQQQSVSLNRLRLPDMSGNTAVSSALVGVAPGTIYDIGGRLQWNSLNSVGDEAQNSVFVDVDYGVQYWDNSQGLLMGNFNQGCPSPQNCDADAMRKQNGYDPDYNIYRTNIALGHTGNYIHSPNSTLIHLSTESSLQYNLISNDGRNVANASFRSTADRDGFNGVKAGDDRELRAEDFILNHKTLMTYNFGAVGLNLSVGGRYWYNTFNDKQLQIVELGADSKKHQHIGALFAEGEFMLFDRVFLTLGARENFNSIFGANFSPRAYIAYNAIDKWLVFKGGVSTGYKTPALNYLSGGIVAISRTGLAPSYGNPNLTPETSVNYELSALSDNDFFSTSVTGFWTEFKDRISSINYSIGQTIADTSYVCPATATGGCGYYINIGEAEAKGVEFGLGIKPIGVGYGDISLNTAYTYTKTKITKAPNNSGVGNRLTNVPLHSVNATLNYDTRYFGVYVSEEFKSGFYRTPSATFAVSKLGENYDDYYLTHLGAYFRPTNKLQINFAVYNLFNFNFLDYDKEVYDRNEGSVQHRNLLYANRYNYIREGRRFYLSFQMDF